jgi:hypothetical protein
MKIKVLSGRRKEIPLEVASELNGYRRGRSCCSGPSGMLAPKDELAGALPAAFLPGLPGMWNQASF